MTISITVEELKAHESALQTWANRRTEFIARAMFSAKHSLIGPMGEVSHDRARATVDSSVEKFDAENPKPRLIPQV